MNGSKVPIAAVRFRLVIGSNRHDIVTHARYRIKAVTQKALLPAELNHDLNTLRLQGGSCLLDICWQIEKWRFILSKLPVLITSRSTR